MTSSTNTLDLSGLDQLSIRCSLHGQYIQGIKLQPTKGTHLKCWLCAEEEKLNFSDLINLKNFQIQALDLQNELSKQESLEFNFKAIEANNSFEDIQKKIDSSKLEIKQNFEDLVKDFKKQCDEKYEQVSKLLDNELNTLKSNINNYNSVINYFIKSDKEQISQFFKDLTSTSDVNKFENLVNQFINYQDFAEIKNDDNTGQIISSTIESLHYVILEQISQLSQGEFSIVNECSKMIQEVQNKQYHHLLSFNDLKTHSKLLTLSTFQSKSFENSTILNTLEQKSLISMTKQQLKQRFKLNLHYRGSIDGFDSETFHQKCDPLWKSLVLIETTTGSKFGGYAPASWDKDARGFCFSDSSWLFSLDRKEIYPVVYCNYAIYRSQEYGPAFGKNDLVISNDCNKGNFNLSELGRSYQNYEHKSITGDKNFNVKEIEVYDVNA